MIRWSLSILAVTAAAACGSPPLPSAASAQPAPRASADAAPARPPSSPPPTAEQCAGCWADSFVQREGTHAGEERPVCLRANPQPESGPRAVPESDCDERCCSIGFPRLPPPAPLSDTRWVVTMSGSKCTATEGSSGPREIPCPDGMTTKDSFIVVQRGGRDLCFRPMVEAAPPTCIGHMPCGHQPPPRDLPTACPR
jgi:hypothetical protein